MTTATWPVQAENWMDRRGKGAWIAATVLAFVVFWPLGLALLAYLAYTRRIFARGCSGRGHLRGVRHMRHAFRSSGNTAFDAYKADTIRRLEEDQDAFEAFLQRLREAKDKSEFDQFMADRAERAKEARSETGEA